MELNADLLYTGRYDNLPIGRVCEALTLQLDFQAVLRGSGILRNEAPAFTGVLLPFSEQASRDLASNVPADQIWGNEG